jgi:hypothetical protein
VFPEVFSLRGGFDAIVGNPPFLGGQKLTGAMGQAYREYLVDYPAMGKRGSADFVAYFELRAHQLVNEDGQTGLIATNTLAQGDSREVGLDQIVDRGARIRRAIKSERWPSKSAMLEYCAVWTSNVGVLEDAAYVLGDAVVPNGISTALNPATREASWVESLKCNDGVSFIGSYVLGMGFTLSEREARAWIDEDARYAEVLFPYLNGQDVNQHPEHLTDRWIIDFQGRSLKEAENFGKAMAKVIRDVKPEREKSNDKSRREIWWRFTRPAPEMRKAIAALDRCMVITRHTHVVMPAMVSTAQVFSDATVVIASDAPALLAVLSSAPHYWWSIDCGSTMKGDLRYTPTDVFETLVRPQMGAHLNVLGQRLDVYRRNLMISRSVGLTAIYNLVHNPDCHEESIVELRGIHAEIDKATVQAYGWSDLLDSTGRTPPVDPTHETYPLDHGFHETDQGTRYTIGLLARTEIIDRLRQLNHQAYADEVHLGLHKGVTEKKAREKHPDLPPPSPEAIRKRKEQLAARGGSDFGEGAEGALF